MGVVTVITHSTSRSGQSIATLVMLPKSPDLQPLTSDLLTSQLISLKDFSCLRRARIYSHISSFPSYTTPPFTGILYTTHYCVGRVRVT